MKQILLAEDDIDLGGVLKQFLELHQFKVVWVTNGDAALESFLNNVIDICVLDVMMPKMDGFSLAEKMIVLKPATPFVFLTAKGQREDKIKGLKLGADDYIVKPFEADELVLRLKNILRRSEAVLPELETESLVQIGRYVFEAKTLQLGIQDQKQRLTEKEVLLIQYLYQHKNQLIKREAILKAVWHNEDFFSGRSMDVFISRLRKYFAKDPAIKIESIRGVGLEFRIQ